MGNLEVSVKSHLRFSMLLCINESVFHLLSFINCKMGVKLFLLSNPCSCQLLLQVLQSGFSKWDFCSDRKSLFITEKWITYLIGFLHYKCQARIMIVEKLRIFFFFFQFWNVAISECFSFLLVLVLGCRTHLRLRGQYVFSLFYYKTGMTYCMVNSRMLWGIV